MRRRIGVLKLLLLSVAVVAIAVAGVLFLRQGGLAPYRVPTGGTRTASVDAKTLAHGEYLARIGNCVGCHTARGGAAFAGGRAFTSDYGTIFSTNLTPDARTGIGDWSLAEFSHAMRNGVSRNGVLYPVFPYAQFALLSDADIAAIFAYLRSLPATAAKARDNELSFPASWRPALIGWRMLYFRVAAPAATRYPRGRYLVDGLGHCAMCHSARGSMESLPAAGYLAGGRIPGSGWYAPPLDGAQLQRYSVQQLADYLRSGSSIHGAAYGPMAEVIYGGLQALHEDDALAISRYLKSIPAHRTHSLFARAQWVSMPATSSANGAEIYRKHCSDCHGADGAGEQGKYPSLHSAVSMTATDPIDAVRMVLYGGLPPTTRENPQPFSMPPFVYRLSPAEIAAVVNFARRSWGAQPSELTGSNIERMEGIVIE